ncbi:MAG: hypothetical protein HY851_01645 [candidate division Zixibacteria bacterium]|nr:hypothetical protein [candidate division Zixibacteria bacterium]
MFRPALVLSAVVFCVSVSVQSATIRVPQDQPTIQAGIDAAVNGDIVTVAAGTYTENIDYGGRDIVVIGTSGALATTLSPVNPYSATVRMTGLTGSGAMFRGFTVQGGGATYTVPVSGGSPTITECVFRNNIPFGSANIEVISCSNTAAFITRTVFYGNGGIGCIGLRSGAG